ncbi:MAG: hypothetical protein ACQES2_10610 [Pseudomonadota bacterium]
MRHNKAFKMKGATTTVRLALCLTGLVLSLAVLAEEEPPPELTIVVPQTPLWANEHEEGVAMDLLRTLRDTLGEEKPLKYRSLPLKRAILSYAIHHSDCFIGGDVELFRHFYPGALIASTPIKESAIYLYTSTSDPVIDDHKQLDGLSVGVPDGTHKAVLDTLEDNGATYVKGRHYNQLDKLLGIGRIDAIVGPDLVSLSLPDLHHASDYTLVRYQDTIHCHDNEDNRRWLESLNPALAKLKKGGYIERLIQRHAGKALPTD